METCGEKHHNNFLGIRISKLPHSGFNSKGPNLVDNDGQDNRSIKCRMLVNFIPWTSASYWLCFRAYMVCLHYSYITELRSLLVHETACLGLTSGRERSATTIWKKKSPWKYLTCFSGSFQMVEKGLYVGTNTSLSSLFYESWQMSGFQLVWS